MSAKKFLSKHTTLFTFSIYSEIVRFISWSFFTILLLYNILFEEPLITNLTSGTYQIVIIDNNLCEFTLSDIILFDSNIDCIYISNAFTPNNDGINDLWEIKNLEIFEKFSLNVYNRWGQLIFATNNPENKWDGTFNGKELPTGSYIYVLKNL